MRLLLLLQAFLLQRASAQGTPCAENKDNAACVAYANGACYSGVQTAVDAITNEGDVWIIRSVELPAAVTLANSTPSSINFRGCDGVRVTCGPNAGPAFDIKLVDNGELTQLESIGMFGFTVADCTTNRGAELHAVNVTIQYMTFDGNGFEVLSESGGGLYINGNATIEYSAFTNNMIHSMNMVRGAGLYGDMGGEVNIRHSLFDANIGNVGAGVACRGVLNAFNTTFSNNEANLLAGAYASFEPSTISNCTFENNVARGESSFGNIFMDLGGVIEDSVFRNNTAAYGGAVYLNSLDGEIAINNCIFEINVGGNTTSCNMTLQEGGGAIYTNAKTTITNSIFDSNAGSDGGAVSLWGASVLRNCTFTSNMAKNDGGAFYFDFDGEANVTISACTFKDNVADSNAGAGWINSPMMLLMDNSVFEGNTANGSAGSDGLGGAISTVGPIMIRNSRLISNSATLNGGALFVTSSPVSIQGSTLSGNTAQKDGGAVYTTSESADVSIEGSTLSGNTANENGGAVAALDASIIVADSSIDNNQAVTGVGGGLFADLAITLQTTNITCNRAGDVGGGLNVNAFQSEIDDASSQSFLNNIASKCPGYSTGRGAVCEDNVQAINSCQCQWPKANLIESCGAEATCLSNSAGAVSCQCITGQWYNGTNCMPCSECGGGERLADCTATADTVCKCPDGKTGNNCEQDCALPPQCTKANTDTCAFDQINPSKGVRCEECAEEHFVAADGQCQPCSTCGKEGSEVQECAADADTVCRCPRGLTGADCTESCQAPPGCASLVLDDVNNCKFSATDFTLGIPCTTCKKNYYKTSDKQCLPLTVCGPDQYESTPATESSDRVCSAITVCTDNQYQAVAPTATTDRVCKTCSPESYCAEVASNGQCTRTQNTQCVSCVADRSGPSCDMLMTQFTLDTDYDSFTEEDGQKFAEQMASLLNVDPSEVEYTGASPGSTVVNMNMGEAAVQSMSTLDPSKLPANVMSANVPGQQPIVTSTVPSSGGGGGMSTGAVVGAVVGAAAAVAAICGIAFLIYKKKQKKKTVTVDEMIKDIQRRYEWMDSTHADALKKLSLVGSESGWYPRSGFAILDVIGKGQFGQVSRGVVFVEGTAVVCAVKQLHSSDGNVLDSEFQKASDDFLREAELLKTLDHPNVVHLLGVSMDDPDQADVNGPSVYMLLEYMDLGDLRRYLQANGPNIDTEQRLWYCSEIAAGMAYLASIPVVHRDVAARNVLLKTNPNSNGYPLAKISDMGLARLTTSQQNYVKQSEGGVLPVRWMAPETLQQHGVYTEASDVWGFGVCVWEIFSDGALPYEFCDNSEFLAIQKHAQLRLNKPAICPDKVYDVMATCWETQPETRPKFAQLEGTFSKMFEEECPDYNDFKDTQGREDEVWGLGDKGGKKDNLNQNPYDAVGADGISDYDHIRPQAKDGLNTDGASVGYMAVANDETTVPSANASRSKDKKESSGIPDIEVMDV